MKGVELKRVCSDHCIFARLAMKDAREGKILLHPWPVIVAVRLLLDELSPIIVRFLDNNVDPAIIGLKISEKP